MDFLSPLLKTKRNKNNPKAVLPGLQLRSQVTSSSILFPFPCLVSVGSCPGLLQRYYLKDVCSCCNLVSSGGCPQKITAPYNSYEANILASSLLKVITTLLFSACFFYLYLSASANSEQFCFKGQQILENEPFQYSLEFLRAKCIF